MSKHEFLLLLLLVLGSSLVGCGKEAAHSDEALVQGRSPAAESQSHAQALCPIMGGKVDPNQYVDVEGQRIRVCCAGCLAKIEADPEKALATLASRGEHAESLQKICPIMGKAIDGKLFVEFRGRRIYACCGGCLTKIRKDPAGYARKVADAWSKGKN